MRLPLPPGASRITLGVALVALLVGPPFVSSFLLALLTQAVIYAVLAMSLDVILGYIGLASLGHAAYLGLGAYSVGILATSSACCWRRRLPPSSASWPCAPPAFTS
jgi:branched-chain amino acid transport system permease protein